MVQAIGEKIKTTNLIELAKMPSSVAYSKPVLPIGQDVFVKNDDFEESLIRVRNKYVGTINNKATIVNLGVNKDGSFRCQGNVDNKKFDFSLTNFNKMSTFEGVFDEKKFHFEFEKQGFFFSQTQTLSGSVDSKPVSYTMKFGKPAKEFNYDEDLDLLLLTMSMLGNSLHKNKNSETVLGYSAQQSILEAQALNETLSDNLVYSSLFLSSCSGK